MIEFRTIGTDPIVYNIYTISIIRYNNNNNNQKSCFHQIAHFNLDLLGLGMQDRVTGNRM